jgi:hypothetical protein
MYVQAENELAGIDSTKLVRNFFQINKFSSSYFEQMSTQKQHMYRHEFI